MTVDPKQDGAYRATLYRVQPPGDGYTLRVDESSAELASWLQQLQAETAIFITAHNPASQVLAPPENESRQRQLLAQLEIGRYVLHAVRTQDPSGTWPDEPGFLVFGLSLDLALQLARDYGQNAILYARADGIPRLVWT